MNINRILAMIKRHIYIWFHSFDQLVSTFFWSTLDVFIWGFTTVYFEKINLLGADVTTVILSALIFWLIMYRAQYEIGMAVLEEIWNQNLINIFSTPIRLSEWITSTILIGMIKIVISTGLAAALATLAYRADIFQSGLYLIPFWINLVLFGWTIGFFVAGLIYRYGTAIQAFCWMGIVVLMPFSAVYYPVSVLPPWAQKVSLFVPPSYIFEGMRSVIFSGNFEAAKLIAASLLNFFYFFLALFFLYFMFKISKIKGLARLE